MKQDALQARGDAMKERLMKQVVMVLLFAVAMLLADHSHIDVVFTGQDKWGGADSYRKTGIR